MIFTTDEIFNDNAVHSNDCSYFFVTHGCYMNRPKTVLRLLKVSANRYF